MIKTLKRIFISIFSILGISLGFWILFLLNPCLSYAHETHFDFVTVYHNQDLEEQTELVLNDAIAIIRQSTLFNENTHIQLCLNDDQIYPYLHPLVGNATAFARFNKAVLKNCTAKFDENASEFQWEVNNYEFRKFNLTWLLAHEFTHNLQYQFDVNYVIKSTLGKPNWKLEGHAEYIARGFKNDGLLKEKIDKYLFESQQEQTGLPVFELEDKTKQILPYYKYALVIQFLMEEKGLDYYQVCKLDTDLNILFAEMIDWKKRN